MNRKGAPGMKAGYGGTPSISSHNSTRKPQGSPTIVCDVGACSIKVGYVEYHSRNNTPYVTPCVVATLRDHVSKKPSLQAKVYGKEAQKLERSKNYSFSHPIDESGRVVDLESLQHLLAMSFKAIGVEDTKTHKVLLTKPRSVGDADLARLIDLLFDTFQFRAVTMHEQAALVLYSQGLESGMVVELGDSTATIVPIFKGHAIPSIDKRLPFSGHALSKRFVKLLALRGYPVHERTDIEIGRQLLELCSYVALDPEAEIVLASNTTVLEENVLLKDGRSFAVGKERFEATEALFQPKLVDSDKSGLADAIFETFQEAGIDCRVELYTNIVLSGGMTGIPGIKERLEKALNAKYRKEIWRGNNDREDGDMNDLLNVQVKCDQSGRHLVFEGAMLYANFIGGERSYWVSRKQYEQEGLALVLSKCSVKTT